MDGRPASLSPPDPRHASSLDPHETSLPEDGPLILPDQDPPRPEYAIIPLQQPEASFRHSHWLRRRLLTWRAICAAGTPQKRRDRFANCGSAAFVFTSPSTGRLKIRANYCHDRLCEPCAAAKSRIIADRLAANMRTTDRCKFITLTLRKSSLPLHETIDRLYRCFAALRRRPEWKARIRGGAAMLEVKRTPKTPTCPWHVHMHIVCDGDFLAQRDLSALWHAVTGDSYIVDVRPIVNPRDMGKYVAKYSAKGCSPNVMEDHQSAVQFILATKGRRVCATFGAWRGIPLNERPDDPGDWQPLMPLAVLISRARGGDPVAAFYLKALRDLCDINFYEDGP